MNLKHAFDGPLVIQQNVTIRDERRPTLRFALGPVRNRKALTPMIEKVTLTDAQELPVSFPGAVDSIGNPVALAAPIVLTASDPSALTILPDPASKNAFVIQPAQVAGKLGIQQVTATDGVATSTFTVEVIASAETALAPTIGAPAAFGTTIPAAPVTDTPGPNAPSTTGV